MLGLVGFVSQLPTFFTAPLAGVLADHWDRRKILIVTQIFSMAQALALSILVLTNTVTLWEILVLGVLLGLVNGFDIPARQAFVAEIIEKPKDLGNAIALNSTMFNGARLIGSSIAGMIIAVTGEGICFLLNTLSYIPVLSALQTMKLKPRSQPATEPHVLKGLKEGVKYALASPPIRSILILHGVVSLVGMPFTVILPIFAGNILGGGPHTLGFLMGATGLGALIGALRLANRHSVKGLERSIIWVTVTFGVGLILFALSRSLWISLPLMVVVGFGMMMEMASTNTVLQSVVDDKVRGRIMSFYTMAFMGMVPFGSLLAGALAGWIGAPATLILGGTACIAGAAIFALALPELRAHIHPIYVQKGIIQENTAELEAAP